MPQPGIWALSRGLSSSPEAWDRSYHYNFHRDRTRDEAFNPLAEGLKKAGEQIERGITGGLKKVKELVAQELSKYESEALQKGAFSGQRHQVWRLPGDYITIRFGGRIDVASDGDCVALNWGPGGSITGKVPIPGLPPAVTLRPSGSASIRSAYEYCTQGSKGRLQAADLSLTLALSLRGQVPGADDIIVIFAEGGGYVNGTWDLVNGGKNKYTAGWFARGVFDVNMGGMWNERYEFKWSSNGSPDIL
jgi:hypothetical protein